MKFIENFLRERTGITPKEIKDKINEKVPVALIRNFFFALGAAPLICFVFQIVTGLILACFYFNYPGPTPSGVSATYKSVELITNIFPVLPYIRGIHQISAHIMIVTIFLHMLRVFFTESYRKPRELVWVCGMLLLFATMGAGFTGYALVGDQLSYWATQVGTNIAAATPIIGPFIKRLLLAGVEINYYTTPRFYVFHFALIPMAIMGLIVAHLFVVRAHGISYGGLNPDSDVAKNKESRRSYYYLIPDHIKNECKILAVLLISFIATVYFFPPTLGEPANPLVTPHVKPEWYFYPMYHFLKLVPERIGILATMGVFAAMTLWPFIQTITEMIIPYKIVRVIAFACGTILMIVCMWFTVLEALT